jgi:hypothetical protein
MSRQTDREAVLVRGVLDGGERLEWRARESATIYVGSDQRCQWQLTADGVAPFHWHLCWYGRRLWMSELAAGAAGAEAPRSYKWKMAPIGCVMRLGSTVMVLEVGRDAVVAQPASAAHADPTVIMRAAADDGIDPDATQLVAPDDLRALPPFGPPSRSAPVLRQRLAAAPEAARPAAPALDEMFIVPAQQPAPPPRPPSPLSRLTAVVPVRVLIAVIAAGGMTMVTLLPEGLHAEREKPTAARVPPRRQAPEPDIEVRAVKPDAERAAAEAAAARDLAAGRLEEALRGYRELHDAAPDDPVFRDFTSIIERRVKARCVSGDCTEETR